MLDQTRGTKAEEVNANLQVETMNICCLQQGRQFSDLGACLVQVCGSGRCFVVRSHRRSWVTMLRRVKVGTESSQTPNAL